MKDLKILAIDPATQCGFAHTCGAHGTWDLSVRKDESNGMRLVRFEGKIYEVLHNVGIDVIAYEGPNAASGGKTNLDGFKLISKLAGIIERLCELSDAECQAVNLSTIKKHAGCRKKDEMLEKARLVWPDKDIQNDNESDALWLLDLVRVNLGMGDGHAGRNTVT